MTRAHLDPRRLGEAVSLVAREHADKPPPKTDDVPYLNHLLQVAGLVLAYGGDEDQAIAALCHDLVEDTDLTAGDVEARFGSGVRRIVEDCTDTFEGDSAASKSPWRSRKEAYLAHLAEAPERSLLVATCDKVSNLESLVRLVRDRGPEVLDRFNAGPAEQVWLYRSFVGKVGGRVPAELESRLVHAVGEFKALVGDEGDQPSTDS